MKKIIEKRLQLRHNMLSIIAVGLCFYFSYHLLLGERSYWRLQSLEKRIEKTEARYNDLHTQRVALESRVVKLRPDTLDRDMLEERARTVLGYVRPDEKIILHTNQS